MKKEKKGMTIGIWNSDADIWLSVAWSNRFELTIKARQEFMVAIIKHLCFWFIVCPNNHCRCSFEVCERQT